MPLPAELLLAISSRPQGRVILVIGAGTSMELPTGLPSSSQCAEDAHRKLLADGILTFECENPSDLSVVADKVYELRESQRELVARLPRPQFQMALPNDGHLLAAAMLVEGALKDVLTLNYDLAIVNALVFLRAGDAVSVIQGPEHHSDISQRNVIYLHRSAYSDPERWIIRTESLEEAWNEAWESVITNMFLAAPVVVFVGLGSPAAVLTETIARIAGALEEPNAVFYVGPGNPEDSEFFEQLELDEDAAVSMGWVEFMNELSGRVVEEQRVLLEAACGAMADEMGVEEPAAWDICQRLASNGLMRLGEFRASWLLHSRPYIHANNDRDHWMADMILAVAMVERLTNSVAHFLSDGLVEFRRGDQSISMVVLAHGRARFQYSTMEDRIARKQTGWRKIGMYPRSALLVGAQDSPQPAASNPINIVAKVDGASILDGPTMIRMISVVEIREDPNRVDDLISQ